MYYRIIISKLRQCCSSKQLYQIHGFLISTGFNNDNILLSKFIKTCSKFGLSNYGYSVFKHTFQPCIYLYNTMIKSLSLHHSSAKDSIFLFNKIRVDELNPDNYSFPFVLKAAGRVLDVNVGRQVHGQVVRSGFDEEIHVVVALVQAYSAFGVVENARQVFDEMLSMKEVALWNAMVAGYVGVGDMENAREMFERMGEKNVISWTSLVAGYVHVKRPKEAVEMFERMRGEGVELDEVALLAALSACVDLGALGLGMWIHGFIDQHGLCKSVRLCNALVDMYLKSGCVEEALQVFESMQRRSVVSWTTVIVGLAFNGLGKEALEIFSRMERAGTKPNEITFMGILSACSHVGLVELARSYFNSMSSKYGITPKIQHYGCMIDLLGRAGCLREAEELLERMPFNANASIWGSILAAARIHRDSSLAEKALQCLSVLEPNNSGNYTLLSNTYAALGEWNEARLVRTTMRSSGVKKLPGGSSVEINGRIHSFVAGDVTNPQAMEIHDVLWQINQHCKMEGCEVNRRLLSEGKETIGC